MKRDINKIVYNSSLTTIVFEMTVESFPFLAINFT